MDYNVTIFQNKKKLLKPIIIDYNRILFVNFFSQILSNYNHLQWIIIHY